MQHDESGTREVFGQVPLISEIGWRLEHPWLGLARVELPLQVLEQLPHVQERMVAILPSKPGEKTGHLEIRDRPVGVEGELQKICVLLGIERSHVVRRVGRRVRSGSPFEKPDGFGNARVSVARHGVRERRRVETLPEKESLKIPGLGEQAVQLGRAHAWQAANHDRRQQLLLQDFRCRCWSA
jgi:hypothetical protein